MSAKVKHERGAYWLVVHDDGKRTKRRFGPAKADRARAEKAADEINHRLALGLYGARLDKPAPLPFDREVRAWLLAHAPTFKPSYQTSAAGLHRNHLIGFFGTRDLREIRREDLLAFVREKIEAGCGQSTVRNALGIVARVLSLAQSEGRIDRNPATRLGELLRRVSRGRASEVAQADSWSREEVQTLLALARQHEGRLYPALLVLFSTGLRRGELLGLRWEDVDFGRSRLGVRRALVGNRLTTPKSGKARFVALPPGTVGTLRELLGYRRREQLERGWAAVPEWLFPSQTGGTWDVRDFERSWLRLRRRAQKAGVRPLKLHSTRHTYASVTLAAGKSVRWVAEQLGHSNAAFTLRVYAHVLPSEEGDLSAVDFAARGSPERHYTAPGGDESSSVFEGSRTTQRPGSGILARPGGLEPPTLWLEARRSIRLSYGRAMQEP